VRVSDQAREARIKPVEGVRVKVSGRL